MSGEIKTQREELSGFDVVYQSSLKAELLKHEPERKLRFTIGIIVGVLLFVASLYLTWFVLFKMDPTPRRSGGVLILIILVPVIGYMGFMYGLRKKAQTTIMQTVSSHLEWKHIKSDKNMSKALAQKLDKFGMLPKYDSLLGGDIFFGKHEDTSFMFSELFLSKMEGWGSNRSAVPVFKGCILSFQLTVHAPETTLIARAPIISNGVFKFHGAYQDSLGSVHVCSNNQNAFNTIICDRFKNAITELSQTFENLDITCVIEDNWLHIPLTSHDRFELDWLMTSFEHPERVQKIIHEFEDVMHMLDIVLRRRNCPKSNISARPKFTY